uniref:Ribosomal protein L13 n=1 Tax=Oryza meridionalis TaxID=40149 RepID=A0A0E0EIA5_9ORYZ
MAAAPPAFTGNLRKALAGLRRINLDGLRWRVFDAKGQGRNKPTYAPHVENGNMCVVLNAKDISVTGRKMTDKIYYWHTGYIGHLKERRLKDQMEKDPTEVIRKAVMRMLPRNRLRDDRDRKLMIFSGSEHPFHDRPLEPFAMPPRQVREMRPRARRALIRAQKKEQDRAAASTKDDKDGKSANTDVTS